MSFTINTALIRYAFIDCPTPLFDPPALGHIIRVDLGREHATARLAHPQDLVGHHRGELQAASLPAPPAAGETLNQEITVTLPPVSANAVEAWLTGVLAPLVTTIRAGVAWTEPIDRHDAEPLQRLIGGLTPAASEALVALAFAQREAWSQGLDTEAVVPELWRAHTWCHARCSRRGLNEDGLLGGFTVNGDRYLRVPEGGAIRQWWPGSASALARLLIDTSAVWYRRPHQHHRNGDLAVLVWKTPELAMELNLAESDQLLPDAVAMAEATPSS